MQPGSWQEAGAAEKNAEGEGDAVFARCTQDQQSRVNSIAQ